MHHYEVTVFNNNSKRNINSERNIITNQALNVIITVNRCFHSQNLNHQMNHQVIHQ